MLFVKLYVVVACVVALVFLTHRWSKESMDYIHEDLQDVSQLTGFDERTIMNITSIFLAIIWPVTMVEAIKIFFRRKHK